MTVVMKIGILPPPSPLAIKIDGCSTKHQKSQVGKKVGSSESRLDESTQQQRPQRQHQQHQQHQQGNKRKVNTQPNLLSVFPLLVSQFICLWLL